MSEGANHLSAARELTDAQLTGLACVHCSATDQSTGAVPFDAEIALIECVDVDRCVDRAFVIARRRRTTHSGG